MRVVGVLALFLGACSGAPSASDATFHRDVRPILEASCTSCHVAGGIGPLDLSYDASAWQDGAPAWAALAAHAVAERTMPPWMPADDCHPLADGRGLTEADRASIAAWAEAGFPEGDVADFVPREAAASKVSLDALGTPDLTLSAEVPYRPDASTPDDYRCFVVDHDFVEDAWVRAFTVDADRAEVVHHVILYRLDAAYADDVATWDAEDDGPGYTCFGSPGTWDADTLAGWAPGQQPEVYADGIARRIEAGSKLVLQVHYNTLNLAGGEAPEDLTSVLLWLADGAPTWQLYSVPLANTSIRLPAGKRHIVEKDEFSLSFLPFDVTAVGVFPHMHKLGTSIRLDHVDGGGGKSCVVDIPRWDFDWQQSYFFEADASILVSSDDILRLTCTYDNSAANQPVVNGEPQEPRDVRWGDGSLDEMCLVYAHVLVPPGLL